MKPNYVGSYTQPHRDTFHALANQVMAKLTAEHAQQAFGKPAGDDEARDGGSVAVSFFFRSERPSCGCVGCTVLNRLV